MDSDTIQYIFELLGNELKRFIITVVVVALALGLLLGGGCGYACHVAIDSHKKESMK